MAFLLLDLSGFRSIAPSTPFPPDLARLHGVPELPPHYLPREADLAGHGNVGITGQSSAVGVQGMGGIGKTVLTAALGVFPVEPEDCLSLFSCDGTKGCCNN